MLLCCFLIFTSVCIKLVKFREGSINQSKQPEAQCNEPTGCQAAAMMMMVMVMVMVMAKTRMMMVMRIMMTNRRKKKRMPSLVQSSRPITTDQCA